MDALEDSEASEDLLAKEEDYKQIQTWQPAINLDYELTLEVSVAAEKVWESVELPLLRTANPAPEVEDPEL